MNSIMLRRSIRKYKDQAVEPEKLELLLRAAMCAPTAGNQREWEFIVVTEPELLSGLAEVSPYAGCVRHAPLAIVLTADKKRMRYPENWEQDMGACCENILIAAVELGLGGVWLGIAPLPERMEKTAALFHLPEDILPFAILSIGYPDEQKSPLNRYDRDRVFYNQYGNREG